MNESWKRHIRKNGDKTVYTVIPKDWVAALDLPISELLKAQIEFKIQDGKAIIELRR